MEKLKRRIEHNNDRLQWFVIGEKGAIHLWCSCYDMTCGGIEIHSREPQFEGHEPTKGDCWVTGCKCYADGSSLQYERRLRHDIGSEFSGPSFSSHPLEGLWLTLANEYRQRFRCEAEIDWDASVIADATKGGA